MEIIRSLNEIRCNENTVVTIGNFDGLHKGHMCLINKTINYAKENNFKSVLFTFDNHPINYFFPRRLSNILSNDEKIKMVKSLGVDILIIIPFDEYMINIPAEDFLKEVLIDKLNMKKLIIGHDFTFARNKEGNTKLLKKLCNKHDFLLEVVPPVKIESVRVSSTYIRRLISEGNIDKVINFLGYNYSLQGEVIHCKKLGRTIGFPTANMKFNERIVIPKIGIYATKVYVDNKMYYGATNIGMNPTVNGENLSVETHILNFNKDIYGKNIKVEFLERIRDERKFDSLDDLKNQLKKDTNYVFEKYICK